MTREEHVEAAEQLIERAHEVLETADEVESEITYGSPAIAEVAACAGLATAHLLLVQETPEVALAVQSDGREIAGAVAARVNKEEGPDAA